MIAGYFTMEKQSAEYTYDFGDDWKHKVLLEKILPKDEDATYPVCIKRKRACPPGDCGGVGAMKNCWRLCMTLILRRTKNCWSGLARALILCTLMRKRFISGNPADKLKGTR